MTLTVTELPLSGRAWGTFVSRCEAALPFHHPSWAELLASCYGYRAFALAVTDSRGEIVGGLPALDVRRPLAAHRYVSLPFTDYCPLLADRDHAAPVTRALIATASVHPLELRGWLPPAAGVYMSAHGVRHTLPLADDIAQRISKHHRRNIRRAEQSDLTARFGTTVAEMATFYRLHLMTRHRLGVPVQPWRFFELLARMLCDEQLGFVLTVYHGAVPIAAAVFLTWRGTMIYKYGASDPHFWGLRPNNLLFWQAIQWGCERKLRLLDWGRSEVEDRGLREFKSGWGAREEPLLYSVIGERRPGRATGRIQRAISPVIRRSPAWICRAIGEVLYRYAA